ncbi:MAG: HlyC/CorC family transporter [Candidatus Dormibacteraeota bacterium]|nr:HlyC/CorC family transporter [Candidatus Dormibacteraeota bacterium]
MTAMLVLLVVGLVVAAFAATAETSLTSVSRIRMRSLAEEGNRRAQRVVRLHNDPNAYLTTILTLNTVALIVASTATAVIIDQYLHSVPQVVGTALLALVALMFCEIAPKSLALRFNERVALSVSGVVSLLTRALRPVVGALTAVSRLVVRAATRGRAVRGPFVTEEELKLLVNVGEQEGVVEHEERQMIQGILEMTDKAVREVMVPRLDVIAVDVNEATVNDVIKVIMEHGFSRIPLYDETMDNIIGVVYAKDLLRHGASSGDRRSVRDLAREPYFTPEAKRVGELLHEMRERKVHMAIVVDEHGGNAGIVTLEDLIEEIVGPIRDEYDLREQEEVQIVSDHEVIVTGRFALDDARELLTMEIGESEADTVGGLVYERLGEIPKAGETLQVGKATLTVDAVRGQRIQSVRITSPDPLLLAERNGLREEQTPEEPRAAHG